MPLMPTSWRASFTSSSLKGLMIASIFFMTSRPGVVLPGFKASCVPKHLCSLSRQRSEPMPYVGPDQALFLIDRLIHPMRPRGASRPDDPGEGWDEGVLVG